MMNRKIFGIFVIILLILIIPSSHAQEVNTQANQRSVEVKISNTGDAHVKHVIFSSEFSSELELIKGTVKNLSITDQIGFPLLVMESDNGVMIPPSKNLATVEYDLEDFLVLKDDYQMLEFLYLETTTFFLPEEAELVFVNDRPVYMGDKEGFACHGCQMTLQYSFDEPKVFKNVEWRNEEFLVEVRSHTTVDEFIFDQPSKSITFDVSEKNRFITTIIPLELLWGPYAVFLDDKKIFFHDYINNGTHVWLNIKPETTGEVTIIGTTVVPEFSIIAPLTVGFLMVLIIPLIRKVNLH